MCKLEDAYSLIYAADFNSSFDCHTDMQNGENGSSKVNILKDRGYCEYRNIDFGNGDGASGFQARVRIDNKNIWIEIRLDSPNGKKIGLCQVAGRDTEDGWSTVKTGIYGAVGIHNVYLVFTGLNANIFEICWFKFTADISLNGKHIGSAPLPKQVPYLGPLEMNFMGSGIAGAGGNTDGIWDYLIGPDYSGNNFIESEHITAIIDGTPHVLGKEIRRAGGTGMFYSVMNIDGLSVYLIDFAKMNEPYVTRLVMIDNYSDKAHTVAVHASLIPAPPSVILWLVNKGSMVSVIDNSSVSMIQDNTDHMTVTFNDPLTQVSKSGSSYILETETKVIAPGESYNTALYHYAHRCEMEERYYISSIRSLNPVTDAEECINYWDTWITEGTSLDFIPERRVRDLIEGSIILIKMQQGIDGGIMATPRTYNSSYIRDNHSSLKGMMAAGHTEEAKRFLLWLKEKYQFLKEKGVFRIPNAAGIGKDGYFSGFGNEDNWSAETPPLFMMIAKYYLQKTGDLELLKTIDEVLRYSMQVQLEYADKHDWLLLFNGDETDSYGSGIPLKDKPGKWSMPSLMLCAASLDFFIYYLKAIGDISGIPLYEEKLAFIKASFDKNFWREDLSIYDWYRGESGEWPEYRLTNYHLMPLYYNMPLDIPKRAIDSVIAMKQYYNERGYIPIQPSGINGDFCGHNLGYLLYVLSEINDPMKDKVYEVLIDGGTAGCWGTWSEAYHSDGLSYGPVDTWDNRIHNLRPFETGANIDAILRYWNIS